MIHRTLIAALAAGALLAAAPAVRADTPSAPATTPAPATATAPTTPQTQPQPNPRTTTTPTTSTTTQTTTQTSGQAPPAPGKAPQAFVIWVIVAVALVGLAALVAINGALGRTKTWSLSDALSEESDLPMKDAQGNIVTNNGQPVLTPVLVASTSRLIALYGMFAILLLYLGVGVFVLYDAGTGQGPPSGMDKVETFLMSGLTLFAPYVVNKFASVFQSFAPKP